MNKEERKGNTIYILRKSLIPFIAFLFLFLSTLILFSIKIEDIASSYKEVKRYQTTTREKICFTTTKFVSEDIFKDYNGRVFVLADDVKIKTDVFAYLDNTTYRDNIIGFTGTLNDYECAVSENIMEEFNLKIGSKLRIKKTQIFYTIVKVLDSQSGIDPKYNESGVVILKDSSELFSLSTVQNDSYISFLTEVPPITSLDTSRDNPFILVKNLKDNSISSLKKDLIMILLIIVIVIVILEIFITRTIYKNYGYLIAEGEKIYKVSLKMILINLFEYLLPTILVSIIFILKNKSFGLSIIIPILTLIFMLLVIDLLYSIIRTLIEYKIKLKTKMKRNGD